MAQGRTLSAVVPPTAKKSDLEFVGIQGPLHVDHDYLGRAQKGFLEGIMGKGAGHSAVH